MTRRWTALITCVLLGTASSFSLASDPKPDPSSFVIEAFVKHVEDTAAYPAEAREFVRRTWNERRQSPDSKAFIPEALAVLEPRFKDALQACEAGEPEGCSRMMSELSLSGDNYLAAHAAYFQSRALVDRLQLEYAGLLLSYYLREDENFSADEYTLYTPDMMFLLGYCRFHTFQIAESRGVLEALIEKHPDASPKLRDAAAELLAQTDPAPKKTLGQAEVLMVGAERGLSQGQAGMDTQIQQYKALTILESLICEAKQCEKKCCSSKSGCSKCKGGQQGKQGGKVGQAPLMQSMLPGGAEGEGLQHDAPRAKPGEAWGQMRPAERAKVLQVLQESFPSRYRDLVEQYFTELGKEQ